MRNWIGQEEIINIIDTCKVTIAKTINAKKWPDLKCIKYIGTAANG